MGTKQRICLSLALGLGGTLWCAAQGMHSGGGGGHVQSAPMHAGGYAHGLAATGRPGAGFNSLGATPNAVSSSVGVGADHNYYGPNGFHNPRGSGYGVNGSYSGQYGNRGGYNRRGIGVGIIPFFPYLGYGDYSGYGGAYADGNVPYDPSLDQGPAGPYQAPFPDQQAYQQPMTPPMPMAPPPVPYASSATLAPDATATTAPMPPVTIVLRTGQQLQVQNFAVANGFFWDFSRPAPRKIPIGNIDVAASQKATEASGAEFPDLNPSPATPQSNN